eukprot:TRINITY_DN4405_c0_g1_i1.p1 TRINITY_DN4405_c0_g1~~TRINITY_DN4405_c0_g1_i1.p1  ORF type:complete len:208 (+),score=-17.03 TRINITY_DN4405_c0_g1_i1:182-805(+)
MVVLLFTIEIQTNYLDQKKQQLGLFICGFIIIYRKAQRAQVLALQYLQTKFTKIQQQVNLIPKCSYKFDVLKQISTTCTSNQIQKNMLFYIKISFNQKTQTFKQIQQNFGFCKNLTFLCFFSASNTSSLMQITQIRSYFLQLLMYTFNWLSIQQPVLERFDIQLKIRKLTNSGNFFCSRLFTSLLCNVTEQQQSQQQKCQQQQSILN